MEVIVAETASGSTRATLAAMTPDFSMAAMRRCTAAVDSATASAITRCGMRLSCWIRRSMTLS
ncbi:hypothetical protein D3C86_1944480 [compost metagenome]